jgi:hypothetical protein
MAFRILHAAMLISPQRMLSFFCCAIDFYFGCQVKSTGVL